MSVYYVWDELNGERDEAKSIEATNPMRAALTYAENDCDGWTDGLYRESCSQPIVVENEGGHRQTYAVEAELVPHFRASPVVEGSCT